MEGFKRVERACPASNDQKTKIENTQRGPSRTIAEDQLQKQQRHHRQEEKKSS
jgi:hypothetical protein